ncbi:MAG TPA: hypothetical protein VHE81_15980 [Lacipirellulaceae bacterium]|nr:hypothetical protein [Lacipirellulaceae bacterium]
MIQTAIPASPVYPPPTTVVPLPSRTPGSIFGPPAGPQVSAPPTGAVPAAIVPPPPGTPGGPPVPGSSANPIQVPVVDEDLAWDQIADVVSNYFRITREQRARRSGPAWTEGRIETAPQDGATVLQPDRMDSVGMFNRWESTFQSIRRRATVRVIPDPNGYVVEVIVEKELESLPKPEQATVGPAAFNSEATLPSHRLEQFVRTHPSPRWIPLGRDPALEERMLADIHARLNGVTTQRSVFSP